MSEKLHIALDLDDVVLDFVAGILETVNRDYDANVQPSEITDWNFGQFIDEIIGKPWFEWLEEHAWLWGEKFKPVPGAIGGIEKLRRAGHYIEIVTAKPEWAEDATWLWLAKYKPRVHRLTIVPIDHISNKHEITDADVLVDDKWENCREWAADGRPAILYNRPHNFGYGAPPEGVLRANDWNDVLGIFDLPFIDWPQRREEDFDVALANILEHEKYIDQFDDREPRA
jgi:5'(3')-deoxyribonucleotidase